MILESQLNASQTVANSETSVTSVFDPHRHIAQLLDDIIEHPEVLCAPKATQKRYLKEKSLTSYKSIKSRLNKMTLIMYLPLSN
ncbi:MAG: hypothetical protein HWD59_02365 [Coxiellaceae bacterium]|nr:MAG: hypothetical protein HWD59_02365 [Coxiellaceae bacterium]